MPYPREYSRNMGNISRISKHPTKGPKKKTSPEVLKYSARPPQAPCPHRKKAYLCGLEWEFPHPTIILLYLYMESFAESGLKEEIIKAVADLGFTKPTPIQAQAIPYLINNDKDLVALAQTGTGKTAAFSLPLIHQLDVDKKSVQAFILSPTRELALQIARDIDDFTKYMKRINVVPVYGGASIQDQIRQLQNGGQVVVGTPGRVCDLIRRKKLDLGHIRWVVLDEADEMLSMGFKEELDFILEQTPKEKQTLLFSATMPKDIARIAKTYMRDALEITAGTKNSGAKNVTHVYHEVSHRNRYNILKRIADINPDIYGIIFCRTRRETKEVADQLIQDGYNADALHGDLSQAQRDVVMARFRKRHLQLLVATDVAARGIDVNDLTHVINYMLPDQIESYIHRSGRTGRAGKDGISITIITPRESRKIKILERKVGKEFERGKIPSGREICEVRLFDIIKKLRAVEVDEDNISEFMPAIIEELKDMDKEELIKHIVSFEFNRLVSYYKNAPDLGRDSRDSRDRRDDRDSRDDRQKSRNEVVFARFHINIGNKQDLTPQRLMGLINDFPAVRKVTIGEIEIFKKFSFFDIDAEYSDALIQTFNEGVEFEGEALTIEPVKSPPQAASKDKHRKKRSPNSNRVRRSHERDKFKKKPRKRY